MRPDQPLTIYEIRAASPEALNLFDRPGHIGRLGPTLAGLHWESDFAFIFFRGEPEPGADGFLRGHPELDLRHIHRLTYGQWQDGAGAEPFTVAGLTVIPAAGERNPPDGPDPGSELFIDPGLAFGFGGHPTTRSCLEFLARACEGRGLGGPPRTALDLGAGTGVLSLAAALWGVPRVLGVDYSHLAVEAARRNLRLNRLEDRVEFHRGPAQDFAGRPGELLLANLHLSLQQELFRLKAFHGRRLVVASGLLPAEGDLLLDDLRSIGFQLADQIRTDRWITMFCVNPEIRPNQGD